jgi:group I intron endonuclease
MIQGLEEISKYSMNKTGIYLIINFSNNKFYVGSSFNVGKRYSQHFSQLRLNKHCNSHLQNSYNNNPSAFKMYLLEEVIDVGRLLEREQFWIEELLAIDYGYNQLPVAGSRLGKKMPQESIDKMVASLKGRKLSKEHRMNISLGRKGLPVSKETRRKIGSKSKGSKHSESTKQRISKIQMIPVYQLNKDEEILREFGSLKEAASYVNGDSGHISRCCHGIRKTHKSYKWKFKLIN